MPSIEAVRGVPTLSGYYFDDQRAIKTGATQDGFVYRGDPITEGFDRIRQPGEAVSVGIELSDGRVAWGDCAAVVFSGAGGRDPLFRAETYARHIETSVEECLLGCDAEAFSENAEAVEALESPERPGRPLHTAIRYGVSQALLEAAATARTTTKATVLAETYGTDLPDEPVPVYAQTGGMHRINADKMILKGVAVLPHGSFHNQRELGPERGERLLKYVEWLTNRIGEVGQPGYDPLIHIDVYGQIGDLFGPPFDRPEVIEYFADLYEAAGPHALSVEAPVDETDREAQIDAMADLRAGLASAGVNVKIAADEWCNTLEDVRAFVDAGAADYLQVKTPDLGGIHRSAEAVLYCDGTDTSAFIGGSANETDLSARASAHVTLATEPAFVMAKPGVGVDEAIMIVTNEMRRTLALHDR